MYLGVLIQRETDCSHFGLHESIFLDWKLFKPAICPVPGCGVIVEDLPSHLDLNMSLMTDIYICSICCPEFRQGSNHKCCRRIVCDSAGQYSSHSFRKLAATTLGEQVNYCLIDCHYDYIKIVKRFTKLRCRQKKLNRLISKPESAAYHFAQVRRSTEFWYFLY